MRYEKGHKDATRQRIIDVASRQFRENGVAAVGLAGIMTEAGLTNGAFYTHFESKEDLVRAVLLDALEPARGDASRRSRKANAGLESHDPRLSVAAPSRRSRRRLSDRGAGRRDRAPSEGDPRCLHRQDLRDSSR